MVKIRIRLLALFLAIALVLCGCATLEIVPDQDDDIGDEGTNVGAELTSGYAADNIFSVNYNPESSLNPLVSTSSANLSFMPLIYESLFTVNENYEWEYSLAIDCKTDDGKGWVFTVDTSRTFHDGSGFTAYDAAYSIVRAMYGKIYNTRFSDIIGVSAMSDENLMITISKPNYQFPALLDIPIIPNNSIEQYSPVGTGPYKVAEDLSCMERYPGHPLYEEMPIDKIYLKEYQTAADIISAYEDSLIDIVINDPNSINSLGYGSANETRYFSTTNMHYIGYNMESPFFQSSGRRMAITYAINRTSIVTDILDGCATAVTLPINPMSSLYNDSYASSFGYSMDKFERVLYNSGAEDLDDDGVMEYIVTGIEMETDLIFLVCNDSSKKIAAAREIAETLQSAGIKVTLHELSWNDYMKALEEGEFDMYYGEVRLSADFDLSCLLNKEGSAAYARAYDDSWQTAVNEYLAAPDEGTRRMQCDLMCQTIVENAPITPVCFERQQVLTHRGIVSGVSATQNNIFRNFQDWTINLS